MYGDQLLNLLLSKICEEILMGAGRTEREGGREREPTLHYCATHCLEKYYALGTRVQC